MVWVRIDDEFPEHPKVAQAGPLAMAMQVAGLCYCNRRGTDGFVPAAVARRLLDWEIDAPDGNRYRVGVATGMSGQDVDCEWVIALLVNSGMWSETTGGYYIHDYGDFQPSAEQVEAERQAARERMARVRSQRNTNEERSSDDVRPNSQRSSDYPVPVPVPEPEGRGTSEQEPNDGRGSGGTRRKRRSPSTPLPDDWQPNDRHRQKAASLGVDTDGEAAAFRDHVLAHDKRYADWDRAFHTWLTNTRKFGANAPLNGSPAGRSKGADYAEKYEAAAAQARSEGR